MPSAAKSDSETEAEDPVFLSPEESFETPGIPDQGGAPVLLRRSARKRKSAASVGDMSRGSSTKKKKESSPPTKAAEDPGKSMPRIPRTPVSEAPTLNQLEGSGKERLNMRMR